MELKQAGAGISVTFIKPAAINTPFPEHARNFMDQPARLPQPLYRPEVVADAILFACAHPRRTLYAVGGGLLSSALSLTSPRLADAMMEAFATTAQQAPGDAGAAERHDNLYKPRADGLRGSRAVFARDRSYALQLQKLPLRLAALVRSAPARRRCLGDGSYGRCDDGPGRDARAEPGRRRQSAGSGYAGR